MPSCSPVPAVRPRARMLAALVVLVAPLALAPAADAGWAVNGIPLDTQAGEHQFVQLVADEAGGAYVVWRHSGPASRVRVQHLTAAGDPAAGWIAGGQEVAASGPERWSNGAGSDGAGGVLVGWTQFEQGSYNGWAIRLVADGTVAPGWSATGEQYWIGGYPDPVVRWFGGDGAGGAWFLHYAEGSSCPHPPACSYSSVHGMHHLTPDLVESGPWWIALSSFLGGSKVFFVSTFGGGVVALGENENGGSLFRAQLSPASAWWEELGMQHATGHGVADDGAGGALIAASGGFGTLPPHVMRFIAPSGAPDPGWPAEGLPFRVPEVAMRDIAAGTDGAGGLLILWEETGAAGDELRLQRMLASGSRAPGWPAAGVVVCSATGTRDGARVVADGSGGAFVAWVDRGEDAEGDLYASRIQGTALRDPRFAPDGSPVAVAPGAQRQLSIVRISDGLALLAWEDDRDLSHTVVYAQRLPVPAVLEAGASRAAGLALAGFTPNPAGDAIRVGFRMPSAGPVTLDLFDVNGRRVHREELVAPAGEHAVTLARAGPLPAGLYVIRLRADAEVRTARGLVRR